MLEARLFLRCTFSMGDSRTVFCQRVFPVLILRHISSRSPDSSSAETKKSSSPQMIGEACPLPGILTFHFTSFSIDHSRGAFSSGTTPSPVGPRHPGHSPAELFAKRLKRITVLFKKVILLTTSKSERSFHSSKIRCHQSKIGGWISVIIS